MERLHSAASSTKQVIGLDAPVVFAILFTCATICVLWTRFTSGVPSNSSLGLSRLPPSLPYWIPVLGHLLRWKFDYDGVMQEAKDASDTSIATVVIMQERYHIVSNAGLTRQLTTKHQNQLSQKMSRKRLWRCVFNVPSSQLDLYDELVSALDIPVKFHLNADIDTKASPHERVLKRLQGNIADFVTFNPSLIDQELWERVSAVKVSEDQKLAEVSLLPLTFIFLTHMATDTLISDSLLSDQDHQDVGPLLLAFVQSYSWLMSGLPRWLPHPAIPSAHITRRKVLGHLDAVLDATEDAELQNNLMSARWRMLDDHKAPRSIRTIELLRLLHGLNMPHVLAFWMMVHIIADRDLLDRVRDEATQVIEIIQDAPVMGFSVPPRVTINAAALLGTKTPLLNHCWLETARLYFRGQDVWRATDEFDLEGHSGGVFKAAASWKVNKGDWIVAPYWHSNTDPTVWEEPDRWDPTRHQYEESNDVAPDTKVFGSPGLFGIDEAIKPARLFALAFVASALLLYDFEADVEKGIPKPRFAAGVALPASDVRMRMRRRVHA